MKTKSVAKRRALVASLVAGGAALVPAAANASIITTTVDETVGFGAGELSTLSFTGLPGASFKIFNVTPNSISRDIGIAKSTGAVTFRAAVSRPHWLVAEGSGKTYGDFGGPASGGFNICGANAFGFAYCTGAETGAYSTFRFKDTSRGGAFDYGYLIGSETSAYGTLSYTLDAVVYDNTGARITTAALAAPAPEPATWALAAMVLGAAGMRRWKSRRNQPAV